MGDNDYDPVGGHTKEEADAAYAELLRELHGAEAAEGPWSSGAPGEGAGDREEIAVVGHVGSDTDCVCAAIAYARLRNMTDPGRKYVPRRAGALNAETEYVLARFGADVPELFTAPGAGQKVVLMDHNKKSRIPDGIDMMYDVVEIIDHHRLAGIRTAAPIFVRCQPYGAVSTIIYEMYLEAGMIPDARTAGLLCAGIMSDTYLLRTEKTVRADRLALAALANLASLDIEAFWREMLEIF